MTQPSTLVAPGPQTPPASRTFIAAGEDTVVLFERWQQDRNRSARDELARRFMPLARKLAMRYRSANEPNEDLVQVANYGLVKAIDRFDPTRGLAFSSFAVPTILGELRRHFRDHGWAVHVARGAQERALKVQKAVRELTGDGGRSPSVHQIAQYLEWELSDVLDALEANAAHHATSLDTPVRNDDGEGITLGDTLGDEDSRFELTNDRLAVQDAVKALPLVERRVVALRFAEDLTQKEIGERIGVSQMQVSRLLSSALTRLREHAEPAT
jgi:RNA polymerase sigma-B factor